MNRNTQPTAPGLPRVLIAEDEPHILELINATLVRERRFEVYNATHGAEAIASARQLQPRVAVLDVMMPKVHGLTVCRTLKEAAETQHIGVIMLSAVSSRYSKAQAVEFGADAYLSKPFSPRELVNAIDIVLRKDLEQRALAGKARPSTWHFGRGERVSVIAGPGEPETTGTVKGRIIYAPGADDWGYLVAMDSGLDLEVPWDSVRPAISTIDRAV